MCRLAMENAPQPHARQLSDTLRVEDHGSEFYLVSEGEGHDITLSLEAPVAERLAKFILSRRGGAALGGKEIKS